MTEKEEIEEKIILLNDFAKGKIERDKLENYTGGFKMGYFYTRDIQEAIETVIQALEQKDKEIQELKAKYDKDTHTLQNQLDIANADRVEKDKIIKAMAKYLNSTDIDEDICKTVSKEFNCTLYQNEDFCINCIIAYFQKKAREENE